MNTAVAGRMPVSINHSKAIYAKDVDVDATKNQTLHALASGKVVRSQGAAKYAWTITFVCPEDKAQFLQLQDGGIDREDNEGFTITYTKGAEAKVNGDVTYKMETSITLGTAPTPWTEAIAPEVTETADTIAITFPNGPDNNYARLKITQP